MADLPVKEFSYKDKPVSQMFYYSDENHCTENACRYIEACPWLVAGSPVSIQLFTIGTLCYPKASVFVSVMTH